MILRLWIINLSLLLNFNTMQTSDFAPSPNIYLSKDNLHRHNIQTAYHEVLIPGPLTLNQEIIGHLFHWNENQSEQLQPNPAFIKFLFAGSSYNGYGARKLTDPEKTLVIQALDPQTIKIRFIQTGIGQDTLTTILLICEYKTENLPIKVCDGKSALIFHRSLNDFEKLRYLFFANTADEMVQPRSQ